jgi:hypothetical protein
MLDTLERTTESPAAELPLDQSPAERAEAALREDPRRSDRQIAKAIGVDHKTVGAARARLGLANSPVGNPAASPDKVVGLIAATLAKNGLDPSDPTLFPILMAAAIRKEPAFNPFDPKDDCLIATERLGLACFVNTRNNVVIANGNERDGIDEMVQVSPLDIAVLISRLSEIASEFRDGVYAAGDGGE